MQTSEKVDLLLGALAKFQAGFAPVRHDSTNPAFGSAYTSFEAILGKVIEVGAPLGLLVAQGQDASDDSGINVVTRIYHAPSSQWIQNSVRMPLDKHTPQASGSATTYGKRYGLTALLGIRCGDEDDDGNHASGKVPHSQAVPERPTPVQKSPEAMGLPRKVSNAATEYAGGEIPAVCPVCNGKVWNNVAKKASGEYKAGYPDWTCALATCKTDGRRTGGYLKEAPAGAKKMMAALEGGPGLETDVPDPEQPEDDLPW